MLKFLRENWLWIAAPVVLVFVGLCVLYFLSRDTGAGDAPFDYVFF